MSCPSCGSDNLKRGDENLWCAACGHFPIPYSSSDRRNIIGQHIPLYPKGMLSGAPMNEWISVAERLPDKTEWLLVYGDGAMATRMYNARTREFEDLEMCRAAGLTMSAITHWMYLPKPPLDSLTR